MLATQSCLTLCNPMDCSPPGSSTHGILPGKNTGLGCHFLLQVIFLTQELNPGLLHFKQTLHCLSHWKWKLVTQSCPTLCYPMDSSPPGSAVHGILQARVLEWVAISFSRGSSRFRDQTRIFCISCTGRWVLYQCVTIQPFLEKVCSPLKYAKFQC